MISVGQYELHGIVTSRFGLDGGAMFGVVPKPLWEKKVAVDLNNRIEMVTRSLLISGNGKKILVDTGNGDKWSPKMKSIYNIDTETVNLEKSLAAVGIFAEDITDVIITHLHFDHAGGATKVENGKIAPAFPNARYYVQKENYRHANAPNERDQASYLSENWAPLQKCGVLEILDGPQEIFPGIGLEISHGHTPGQQHPLIFSEDVTVFYCGDLFPTHAHIPVPWIMGYDLEPLVIIEEKKRTLSRAIEGNWIFFYEHDAKWSASRVAQTQKGFEAGSQIDV